MGFFITPSGGRLKNIYAFEGAQLNYLFIPGGPGLGSESLKHLCDHLSKQMRENIWVLDLPNDGSNRNTSLDFSNWQRALIEATTALSNVVIVGHSTGAMYVQATSELENLICGLIIMDSAPDSSWQESFSEYCISNPIDGLQPLLDSYLKKPTDNLLKEISVLSVPYSFKPECEEEGKLLFRNLPINHKATMWSEMNFDKTYKATWIPKSLPVLIFSGSHDKITPVSLYKGNPNYSRNNIFISSIENAAHYPWYENPKQVVELFQKHHAKIKATLKTAQKTIQHQALSQPKATLTKLLNGLANQNWDIISDLYDDDVRIEWPLQIPVPAIVNGKNEIKQILLSGWSKLDFSITKSRILLTEDTDIAIGEYTYEIKAKDSGQVLKIDNVILVKLLNGKIILARGYHNHYAVEKILGNKA